MRIINITVYQYKFNNTSYTNLIIHSSCSLLPTHHVNNNNNY